MSSRPTYNTPNDPEALKKYLQEQMNQKDTHAFEEALNDDPFAMEALEGFEENNLPLDSIDRIQAKVDRRYLSGMGSIYLSAAFIVVVMVAVALLEINQHPKIQHQEIAENTADNVIDEVAESVNIIAPLISDEELIELEAVEITPPKHVILSEDAKIEQNELANFKEETKNNNLETTNVDETIPIELNKISKIDLQEISTNKNTEKRIRVNYNLLFLSDLKVVDYTMVFPQKSYTLTPVLTGTPADRANKESEAISNMVDDEHTAYYTYIEFLNKGMAAFNENDFKGALSYYSVLLRKFDQDVNAQFYSGMCYYNLGKFKKAAAFFQVATYNAINEFEQEAQWYLAQTYLEDGKTEAAKHVLNTIVNDGRFYTKKAQYLLDKL